MIPDSLKDKACWCVSKDKIPKDMHALARGLDWGVSQKRSHSCYVDYAAAESVSSRTGMSVTLWVDSAAQGIYMLDIEKTCPTEIRRAILLALHDQALYLEKSLSGKGFHMMVRLDPPEALRTAKYKKWFEALSGHHCTFTGNELSFDDAYQMEIPENEALSGDDRDKDLMSALSRPLTGSEFYEAIGSGGTAVKPVQSGELGEYRSAVAGFDDRHADLFNALCDLVYEKTVDKDFHNDLSSWEFGYASKLHYALQRMSHAMMASDGTYYSVKLSKTDAVMLVYMVLKQNVPPRDKHKEYRNGLPWLLYTSQNVYAKTFE